MLLNRNSREGKTVCYVRILQKWTLSTILVYRKCVSLFSTSLPSAWRHIFEWDYEAASHSLAFHQIPTTSTRE